MSKAAWMKSGQWLFVLIAPLFGVMSCAGDSDQGRGDGPKDQAQALSASSPASPAKAAAAGRSAPDAPPELRAAYIAAVQREAPSDYQLETEAPGRARGSNPAQALELRFEQQGLSVSPTKAGASFSLATIALGCDGQDDDEIRALPAAEPVAKGNRVEYRRGALVEQYWNGPLGVEQVYTLDQPPDCSGTKKLEIQLGSEVTAELAGGGDDGRGTSALLRTPGSEVALRYTDLLVRDAAGQRVPAWISASPGRLWIHVDDAGAQYPLEIDPLLWVQQQELIASDGAVDEQFGWSVALSGDTALVGAYQDDDQGFASGSAYVFVRSGGTWTEQQKLVATDGTAVGSEFGLSVALSGDTALVGAPYNGEKGANSGAAYVFVRSGGAWTEQQKLLASDGAADDKFGFSVALSGDTAVVGAYGDAEKGAESGSAYAFSRSGDTWTEQQKLLAADGAVGDNFGISVALSGDTALVGAFYDDDNGSSSGSAYVFVHTGSTWTQQQKLLASDGSTNDAFGLSVAIAGDTAVVGAGYDNDKGSNSGSAYVFVRSGMTWTQQQKLLASDGAQNDVFGFTVAVSGDTAVVGAYLDNNPKGSDAGAAYVFVRSGVVWKEQQKLLASDGAASDKFGASVAISGDAALVGAYVGDGLVANSGSAYVFTLVGQPCMGDLNCASGFCVDGVCCNAACGGNDPTDCQACSVAAGAKQDGLCALRSGGSLCRAAADLCDAVETCDGVTAACPTDGVKATGTPCRAAAGACDVVETCDGVTAACPADVISPAGTLCRAVAGACDVEEACDGVMAACPEDVVSPAGMSCRAVAGACDVEETCDGVMAACPEDVVNPAGMPCRAATDLCDAVETCDGVKAACPEDVVSPAGTPCRAATDLCDAVETCDGVGIACPVDGLAPAGTMCRASAGPCDVDELCDGKVAACPDDALMPAGMVCRKVASSCDLEESCDGKSADCPADMLADEGASCPSGVCHAGVCESTESSSSSASSGSSSGGGDDRGTLGDPGSGCACRAAGAAPQRPWGLLLAGLAALAWSRRRARNWNDIPGRAGRRLTSH